MLTTDIATGSSPSRAVKSERCSRREGPRLMSKNIDPPHNVGVVGKVVNSKRVMIPKFVLPSLRAQYKSSRSDGLALTIEPSERTTS